MQNKNELGFLIMGFVTILIGLVLIAALADDISRLNDIHTATNESIDMTETTNTITNESITLTAGAGTTANTSVLTLISFGNASVNTDGNGVDIGLSVNISKDGTLSLNGTFGAGVHNISYTYSSSGTAQTSETSAVTGVTFFGNNTNSTHFASINVNEDVNITSLGVVSIDTLAFDAGNYNITYTYEDDLYVANTTARTLVALTNLFYALAILGIGVVMVMKGFKDMF